jgi:hypothetical protein
MFAREREYRFQSIPATHIHPDDGLRHPGKE